jgi:cell division protein FtsZ
MDEAAADDDADDDMLDLGEMAEADDDSEDAEDGGGYAAAAPFELSGMQAGEYGEDYDDDVDDIVDPLAGLRGAEDTARFGLAAPEVDAAEDAPLDLDGGYAAEIDDAPQDDLLASADRLAAEDRPVEARLGGRRRPLLGGAAGDDSANSGAGSTLFERMANLSRSTARDDDDDDDDGDGDGGGPALSIPRFLGRQNNQ